MKSLWGHPAVSLPCARPVAETDRHAPDREVLEAAPRWDKAVESRSPEEGIRQPPTSCRTTQAAIAPCGVFARPRSVVRGGISPQTFLKPSFLSVQAGERRPEGFLVG